MVALPRRANSEVSRGRQPKRNHRFARRPNGSGWSYDFRAYGPKTDDGQRIWWNYNSHLGCPDASCARSRVFYRNYEALATTVKIASAKRYGFKRKTKSPL